MGRCSSSRMCTWIIAAPAASHRWAVSTSSASVVGSCGQSAFVVSAPVGATVTSSLSEGALMAVIVSESRRPRRTRDRKIHRCVPLSNAFFRQSVHGRREGRRLDHRPRAPGAARRDPRRRAGAGRLDGPQDLGPADHARGEVGLRPRRTDPGGQPVHAVRRRPQGPSTDLERRRSRRRCPSRCTSRSAPSSNDSARPWRAARSVPTCRSAWSTTDRSPWCSTRREGSTSWRPPDAPLEA